MSENLNSHIKERIYKVAHEIHIYIYIYIYIYKVAHEMSYH